MTRTITVKGTGSVSLTPDLTEISMTLKTLDKDYDRAVEQSAALLDGLREALEGLGFAGEELKTRSFNISTQYDSQRDEQGNYRSVFAGYACIHDLMLEFDFDTQRLSDVLRAVAGCIAEPELSIRFSVRDREGASDALLRSAAENARHRAQLLAEASGAVLGQLVSIDYSWGELDIYSRTNYAMDAKCMAMPNSAAMDFTPDDIRLEDNVTFVWELL